VRGRPRDLRYADRVRDLRAPVLLSLTLAVAACGGGQPSGGARPGESGGSGEGAAVASTGPLTEPECMRLLDHYLELAMAEKRATLPEDQVPTEEQVARIRTSMRDEARESCIGKTERGQFDCAMKAGTTRALATCLAENSEGGP
jgi:hypothetical protein